MTSPAPPPPDTEPPAAERSSGRARPTRPQPAVIAGAIVLGLAATVALASRDTPVWSTPREGTTNRAELLLNLAIVAVATLTAALVIALIVHRVNATRHSAPPPLRGTLMRALPITIVAIAVLSLILISRTELEPEQPATAGPETTEPDTSVDPRTATGRLGDFDGDGSPEIGLDVDGDGTVDRTTWPGEQGEIWTDLGSGAELYLGRVADGAMTGGIDLDGDRSIDQRVTFDDDSDLELDVEPGSRVDPDELLDLLEGADDEAPEPDEPTDDDDRDEGGGDGGLDLGALGPVLAVVLIAVVVAFFIAALWAWYQNREKRTSAESERLADVEHEAARAAMAETVESTIDAMLADPDPRTAIIGAYARLLEGLAESGVGRLDHEAPMEHLRRALTVLDVRREPLRRLIDLFSMARFSTHPMIESHRSEALDALRAAADDLAASRIPSPEPAGASR